MLRLRGALARDLPWPETVRAPQIAEQLQVDGQWFRVSNVAWAIKTEGETILGFDVGLWLSPSQPPSGESRGQD